jgi:ribosomal protein S27E
MASPILAGLLYARKRTCAKCGHRQFVSVFALRQAVPCHRCGASIPAPAPGAKQQSKPDPKDP